MYYLTFLSQIMLYSIITDAFSKKVSKYAAAFLYGQSTLLRSLNTKKK